MKIEKLRSILSYFILIFISLLLTASPITAAAAATATPKTSPKTTVTKGKTPTATPTVSVTPSPIASPTASVTPSPSPEKKTGNKPSPVKTINPVQVRDDGLTIIKLEAPKEYGESIVYLSLVLKTGYAHDPNGKAGLTSLTNELVYYLLRNTFAFNSSYYISSDFSNFTFSVFAKDFNIFCKELDDIIRLDALLLYDKCNELIQLHENEPHIPRENGELQLYELMFGPAHPYRAYYNPDYAKLNITEVNHWFRKIYRPNNMIISSTAKIPADFLLKPSGREMAEKVVLDKIPPVECSPIPTVKFTAVRDNLYSVFVGLPMPRIDEDGFFAATLMREYLQKVLWTKLREDLGLCYDLQVSYSYFYQCAAPILMVTFQTLPADAPQAVGQTLQILKTLSREGIRDNELAQVKDRVKNLNERQGRSLRQMAVNSAFQVFFNLSWLSNQNEYLQQINQVTSGRIMKLAAEKLKYLEVSISGPADTEDTMNEISINVSTVNDSIK